MNAAEFKTIRRALRASVGAAAFDAWIAEYTTRVIRDAQAKSFTAGQRDVYEHIVSRGRTMVEPLPRAAWRHVASALSNELPTAATRIDISDLSNAENYANDTQ